MWTTKVVSNKTNKCVGPPYCLAEMYAGRVACCTRMIDVEYAPRALLRLEKDGTGGRTDARPLHYAYREMRLAL